MIHVSDVLDFLVTRYAHAPSTMGAQLERLRYGVQLAQDPFRARREVEDHLMQQAELIRCIDDFVSRREFNVTSRQRTAISSGYKVLEKIQKASHRDQGEIAIRVLQAYQERCTQSQERGLLCVYQYLASVAPESVPTPPKDEPDLLMAFRTGAAKRARSVSCEAYADALLALQNHVRIWNRRRKH